MTINKLMLNKKGVIMGLANSKSLAWGVAKHLSEHGAQIAFTYQNEVFLKRIKPLAEELEGSRIIECDVSDDKSVEDAFKSIEAEMGKIDFLVHAIGFSDKNELTGKYINTSRANFNMTMDVSVYSFTNVACHASRIMNDNGSMITMTYEGSNRVIPHYNVMGVAKAALEASVRYLAVDLGERGVRVNALSAGPIKTLASSGIGDFRYILQWTENNSPLIRNVTIDDVGKSALYLLSDLSQAVTGTVHYVDAGYNIIGMKNINSPDIVKQKPTQ